MRLLPVLLLLACAPTRPADDDTVGGDACGGEPCEITVSNAAANCGQGSDTLTATQNGDAVTVFDGAFTQGCCPTFSADALADGGDRRVTMTWNVSDDFCDCICQLDATAQITGLPAGSWTFVSPGGEEAVLDVE